jgi:tetratricopeptide (TPR) repeat protein
MKRLIRISIALLFVGLLPIDQAVAQHPIEVQREAAQADYLQALITYDKLPKRKITTEATIAAGRSAWGLSLPQRAILEFDNALRDETLPKEQRARLYLSRGAIEYQEGLPQVAAMYAARAVENFEQASALRSRAYVLWGQSLYDTDSYGEAEEKYILALNEADPEDAGEVHFLLGQCQIKLNKRDEARQHLEQVPLQHERTPSAIRYLANISLETGKFQTAEFWLNRGRSDYPDRFLDSWVDYALVSAAIDEGDLAKVRMLRDSAAKKYPPSDPWMTLLNAAAEGFEYIKAGGL